MIRKGHARCIALFDRPWLQGITVRAVDEAWVVAGNDIRPHRGPMEVRVARADGRCTVIARTTE